METTLLVIAAALGLLSFFEPCTISTHTLFAVSSFRKGKTKDVFILWLSRTFFIVSLIIIALVLFPQIVWPEYLPPLILTAMGIIYIVSRYSYIPIPHVEFHKIIPVKNIPFSIQLGFTLPACTIPLFVVVLLMSLTISTYEFAIAAGAIFGFTFSLPIFVLSRKDMDEKKKALLNRAALITPYITAALLFGSALYLAFQNISFDLSSFKSVLKEPSIVGIAVGFISGLLFSFNPVSFASIPMMVAYVTKAGEKKRAFEMGWAFVSGLIVTHVVLGVAAALGGIWVKSIMGREWGLLLGPLLIFLGLLWPGWIKVRLPWFQIKGKKATSLWTAFMLGIPFSVAVCPFCAPALVVALSASAAIGSVIFGFTLLFAFAVGRSIPVLLGAWGMGMLESMNVFVKYQRIFEALAGAILIIIGLYLLNEYFFIINFY